MSHTYKYKDKGPDVVSLQRGLEALGFKLPKYGADGDLGDETWSVIERYAGRSFAKSKPLPVAITSVLDGDDRKGVEVGANGLIRVEGDPENVKGWRPWSQITGIVLHQTGVWMTDTPERFKRLKAHIGILKDHETPIVLVHPLTAYMHHAGELNSTTIGIEINGHFPGLRSDYQASVHSDQNVGDAQREAARDAIRWACDEVAANGGAITHIFPHRVASNKRRGDPGDGIWFDVGLWAKSELGLTDNGAGYCIGDGLPIPYDWCGQDAFSKYPY